MPRIIYLVCSGICLLLTTAAYGQAPLPKHPSLQQIVGYQMRQQHAWNLQQLPANSVLLKNAQNYTAHLTYLHHRDQRKLPPLHPGYSFTIKPAYTLYPDYRAALEEEATLSFLQLYLSRERKQYADWQKSRWLLDPASNFGSGILKEFVAPNKILPPQPGVKHR